MLIHIFWAITYIWLCRSVWSGHVTNKTENAKKKQISNIDTETLYFIHNGGTATELGSGDSHNDTYLAHLVTQHT